jgi:chromosome segregation ATPase
VRPAVPHVPLTPMMDFFQRRLEAVERELTVEKEKARSAQSQLEKQEGMRGEVESHLKAVSEQLRREKAERDSEDMKSHARGRIDALEKRLDEMHQSWVTLLKDAVTSREAGAQNIAASQHNLTEEQAHLKVELSALTGVIANLMEQIGQWRSETQSFTRLLPELKGLSTELPEDTRRSLAQFTTDLRERMSAWQRNQELEGARQTERLRQLSAERENLQRAWDEGNHALRQEQLKERTAREREVEARIAELGKRFDDLMTSQAAGSADAARMREDLSKAIGMLTTPPKAKDQTIAALELEREDLVKALDDRTRDLHKHLDERRRIEKSMGDGLNALSRELEEEREKRRQVSSRIAELEFEIAKLNDQISLDGRTIAEKGEQLAAMSAERDELVRAFAVEAEKARAYVEDRRLSEEAWRARYAQMEQRITSEIELRAKETTVVAELRAQLATLTEHLTKAVRDKDALTGRFGDWETDRQKLLSTIRQKDETISMLNAAFQNMLKKS